MPLMATIWRMFQICPGTAAEHAAMRDALPRSTAQRAWLTRSRTEDPAPFHYDTTCNIMNTSTKRLNQMRANSNGDWRIDDLEAVATTLGMKIRKSGGSHVVFSHPAIATRLTVPARRPIKPIYIRHFIAMADEIRGA